MESKPPLRFRKIRIAWSVVWGIIAVLVVALWARSFWWTGMLLPRLTNERVVLTHGELYFNTDCAWRSFRTQSFYVPGCSDEWMIEEVWAPDANTIEVMHYGFRSPVWPAVVALPLMAAGPWLSSARSFRFSLRTMLFATMVAALGLGILAWLLRK
jgi:hypothetical protein